MCVYAAFICATSSSPSSPSLRRKERGSLPIRTCSSRNGPGDAGGKSDSPTPPVPGLLSPPRKLRTETVTTRPPAPQVSQRSGSSELPGIGKALVGSGKLAVSTSHCSESTFHCVGHMDESLDFPGRRTADSRLPHKQPGVIKTGRRPSKCSSFGFLCDAAQNIIEAS